MAFLGVIEWDPHKKGVPNMTLICINGIVKKVDKRFMGRNCCKWCKIKKANIIFVKLIVNRESNFCNAARYNSMG